MDEPNNNIETMPITIEVEALPITDAPQDVQQILTLLACGFSVASVSRLAKCSNTRIRTILDKYDPQRKFILSSADKQKFLSRLWEAKAAEALLHITPEKLESSNALQLASVASKATEASRSLARKSLKKEDFRSLLSGLSQPPSPPYAVEHRE